MPTASQRKRLKKMLKLHPGIKYTSMKETEFIEVKDGDEINVGDYIF